MGYAIYSLDITMEGPKKNIEKAYSFLAAFLENDDKAAGNDPEYQDFKKKMEALWGKRDKDYFETDNYPYNFEGIPPASFLAEFCRAERDMKQDGSYYLQPFFDAFPTIQIYVESRKNRCNNAGEYSPGETKYTKHYHGKCISYNTEYDTMFFPGQYWGDADYSEITTPEEALKAVRENACLALDELVPDELKTSELCKAAVQKDGKVLRYVPEEYKTEEMCLKAVQSNCFAIGDVPKDLRTYEICIAAAGYDPEMIVYVPRKLRDLIKDELDIDDSYDDDEDGDDDNGNDDTSDGDEDDNGDDDEDSDTKSVEFYLAQINRNPKFFGYLPKKRKTLELCQAVVQNNGLALKQVPVELKTLELCLEAVKQNNAC